MPPCKSFKEVHKNLKFCGSKTLQTRRFGYEVVEEVLVETNVPKFPDEFEILIH